MENQKKQPQPVPVQPETISVPKEEYGAFSAWREKQKLPLEQFEKMLADSMQYIKELASDHNEQLENFNEIVEKIGMFYPAELENILITNGINPFAQTPKNNESINQIIGIIDNSAQLLKDYLFGKK